MFRNASLVLLSSLLLAAPAAAQSPFDACALLTRSEIEKVQGQPVTETKSSMPARTGFAVHQCFYTAALFEKSVSLEVTHRGPKGPAGSAPREDWKRLYHAAESPPAREPASESKKKETREEGKESGRPQRVEGLGEEAFWMGDRTVGALYVLKNDSYFRISVGGWADESVRMKKTIALARKILQRL